MISRPTSKILLAGVSLAAALVLLSGCASTLGDIFGNGDTRRTDPPGGVGRSTVRGTIARIDDGARRIDLTDAGNYLVDDRNGSTDRVDRTIYYDDRTVVEYEERSYSPDDLERGDEIRAVGSQSGGRYLAETITVTRNVRTDGGGSDDDWNDDGEVEVRGLIRSVDSRDRILELDLDRGYDTRDRLVYFDDRTRVTFEGRDYTPENLERGDEIRIFGRRSGGRFYADDIQVVRDARGR